jgi:hypothetical protein
MKRDTAKRGLALETDSVDHAINRVLAAEAAAREALTVCEQQAAGLIVDAEARGRSIAQRAERRMRRAQLIADRGIERALAELRSPLPEAGFRTPIPEDPRLAQLTAVLAQELTRLEPLVGLSAESTIVPPTQSDDEVAERS